MLFSQIGYNSNVDNRARNWKDLQMHIYKKKTCKSFLDGVDVWKLGKDWQKNFFSLPLNTEELFEFALLHIYGIHLKSILFFPIFVYTC